MPQLSEHKVIQLPTGKVLAAAFSPDGSLCAAGDRDGIIHIIDTATGSVIQKLRQHVEFVYCLKFLPQTGRLFSAGKDKSIREWDLSTGKLVRDYAGIFSAAAPTGHASGLKPATRSHRMTILSLDITPDGHFLATGSQDNTLKLWENGDPVRTFDWHSGPVTCVRFQPETNILFSASRDKTIRAWSASNGAVLHRYNGHLGEIIALEFIDRDHFLSVDALGYVNIWNVDQESPVTQIHHTEKPVFCATWVARNHTLLMGCAQGNLEMVSVDLVPWGTPAQVCWHFDADAQSPDVRCIAFSPAGFAASGDNAGKLSLWSLQS